jgi:release factor glutamine methyltransferase
MELHAREIPDSEMPSNGEQLLKELVDQRVSNVPLQYLTGSAPFRYIDLTVGPGVLVPRPETESLVDIALEEIKKRLTITPDQHLSLIDLGAGSGAISLAIENEVRGNYQIGIIAVENSAEALHYLRENCAALQSEVRIVEESVESALIGVRADLVVANPPYIPDEILRQGELPSDLNAEPEVALMGGAGDGMEIPRLFICAASRLLKPGGVFICERFETQENAIFEALDGEFIEIHHLPDLTGRSRFTVATKKDF